MTTAETVLGPALEKVRLAQRALGEAIGAIELAPYPEDRALLTGYSGTSAARYLREARRQAEKAMRLLEALGPR